MAEIVAKRDDVSTARARAPSLGKRLRTVSRRFRAALALALVRLAFRIARSHKRQYEPVEIGKRRFHNTRDSEGRLRAVLSVLQQYDVRNVLDIGCAEGWFVRRAAIDLNCFTLGIEASDRVLIGELSRLHDDVERMAIMKARVSPADLRALPIFDAVICMSVVHHVILASGLAAAEDFLKALASRAQKVLIFEMGTADEEAWASALPELQQGQEVFVRSLLERCGLCNVRPIAESAAFHRQAQRLLFAAEPRV
jgi:hypothetical protein